MKKPTVNPVQFKATAVNVTEIGAFILFIAGLKQLSQKMGDEMSIGAGYVKYFPVSWEELHRNGRALAWRLMEKSPFKGVIAVTRGGMVPAAIVARELDIRHIDTVCIAAYRDDKSVGEVNLIKGLTLPDEGDGWVIVDDLVDSGITARHVRKMVPKAHFATIYAKPKGLDQVDTFITEVSQDTWILFPWDQAPSFAKPIVEETRSGN